MKKTVEPKSVPVLVPKQPQVESTTQTITPSEPQQHVPGQVEIPAVTAENRPPLPPRLDEIPAEGNNLASVFDRAHADTPPANDQPPVEKTFVSPPDEHTVKAG